MEPASNPHLLLIYMKTPRNGTCYPDAYHFVSLFPEAILIHAAVKNPKTGRFCGHAWAEIGDVVFDTKDKVYRKEIFYNALTPINIKRYTQEQMYILALKHSHYGPWRDDVKKRLQSVCGDDSEAGSST